MCTATHLGYITVNITFCMHVLLLMLFSHRNADTSGTFKTKSWLERVIIVGVSKAPSSIILSGQGQSFCVCVFWGFFGRERDLQYGSTFSITQIFMAQNYLNLVSNFFSPSKGTRDLFIFQVFVTIDFVHVWYCKSHIKKEIPP